MAYQAGHRDFQVATGADTLIALRFHERGPSVAASEVVVGDFIIYDNVIWPVYSVTPVGVDKVQFHLGYGTFYEPQPVVHLDDVVGRTNPSTWEDVDMQVAMPDTVWSPPPTTVAVPTELHDEGVTLVIHFGQEWLEPFQAQIDYAEGGPSGMSLPYDLVGQFDGRRIRVLTGTVSIIRSAASPVVEPPIPPEEVVP